MLHRHSSEVSAVYIFLSILFSLIVAPFAFPLWWRERSWLDVFVFVSIAFSFCRWAARGTRCGWPAKVSGKGRVALVTGASAGIGFEVALQLAIHGWTVILAGRHLERLLHARQRIEDRLRHQREMAVAAVAVGADAPFAGGRALVLDVLELSDKVSVHKFASTVLAVQARYPLALLVNGAGVLRRHLHYSTCKDWWDVEEMLATNAVGPMLLTELLLPALVQTAERSGVPSRVVNVSSSCHTFLGLDCTASSHDPIGMIRNLKRNAKRLVVPLGTLERRDAPESTGSPSADDAHTTMKDFSLLNFVGYYGLSKLCVIWNTRLLAERVSGLTFDTLPDEGEAKTPKGRGGGVVSVVARGSKGALSRQQCAKVYVASVHPGIASTHLYRDLLPIWILDYFVYLPSLVLAKTIDEAAQSTLKAAIEVENMVQGGYYMCDGEYGPDSGVNCLSKHATNVAEMRAYEEFLNGLLHS